MADENCFFKGDIKDNKISGRGVFFYVDSQNFYLGEVNDGRYHGKGLYYTHSSESWVLNDYDEGKVLRVLKAGEGRP